MNLKNLYMGTSGLVLPYKNKSEYPVAFEGKSRLEVYGMLFNSIEVNSIFYKLPRASTIDQWSLSVGDEFRFTFKLWKEITHAPDLNFDEAALTKYFEVIAGAKQKSGCILVQFPASVKYSLIKKAASLFSALQKNNNDQWSISVEFRSPTWYRDETYELLNEYGASMVFHDKAGSESTQPELDAGHVYLRFHGPEGDYKGSYDPGLLFEYSGYIMEWLNAGKKVYVYFNNTMGAALDNLRTLEKDIFDRAQKMK